MEHSWMRVGAVLLGCTGIPASVCSQPREVPGIAGAPSGGPVALPRLEIPSGTYGIGRVACHWTDATRTNRFAEGGQVPRELMVYLWYPTPRPAANVSGEYVPGSRDMDAVPALRRRMEGEFGSHWSSIVANAVASHSSENARPADAPRRFPVAVFSHGNGSTSFAYTSLIEDLVSHGYVVAAVEHTHTALAVRFPDGRVIPYQSEKMPEGLPRAERLQWMAKGASAAIEEGAADIRLVLRRLRELNVPDARPCPLAGRLDLDRVAAVGHSAGGAFAARACQLDSAIRACVDLDGGMVPVAALPMFPDGAVIRQPLLLLEPRTDGSQMAATKEELQQYLRTKEQQLQSCARGSYNVILRSPGIAHPSFSDVPLFFAGTQGYPETDAIRHNHRLIESFVRAFLDKNLRGRKAPLLDSATDYPEATVRRLGRQPRRRCRRAAH